MKRRFSYIDWAKAIAIVCVCEGHFLPNGSWLKILMYTFHVPVFFIIAGFLSGLDKKESYWNYTKKLACRVLVPYAIWFGISTVYSFIQGHDTSSYLRAFFFVDGFTIWNSVLWFPPCYFIVSLCHYICNTSFVKKNLWYHFLMALICFTIACIFDYFKIKEFLFGLNKCAYLLGLQYVGSTIKLFYQEKEKYIVKHYLFGGIIFILSGIMTCIINQGNNISYVYLDYNNIFVLFLLSVIMCVSFIWVCMGLPENHAVALFARNTLPLMCGHLFAELVINFIFTDAHFLYATGGIWISLVFFAGIMILSKFVRSRLKLANFLRIFGFQF